MKQSENSIPSFADLALQYDMVTQDQLNEAYLFMEGEKSAGEQYSLEDVLVLKKIATQYQINLLQSVRDFLVIKKKSQNFGYIAVKRGYATLEDVKYALKKQQQLFREKKIKTMIGDILVESYVITKEQQQIIVKEQQSTQKEDQVIVSEIKPEPKKTAKKYEPIARDAKESQKEEKDAYESKKEKRDTRENEKKFDNIEIVVSANAMEAWVKIVVPSNTSASDVSASSNDTSDSNTQTPKTSADSNTSTPKNTDSNEADLNPHKTPITLASIKSALQKNGIINGILSDAILQFNIDKKDDFFPAAVGEYNCSHLPEYEFDIDKLVSNTAIKKNKTLALLKSAYIETRMKDVYGRHVELVSILDDLSPDKSITTDTHPVFRLGRGVTVSEDGTRVLAEKGGYPALSIEGRLYIFPVVNVLGDADLRIGHIEPYSSLNVAGILTGAYPVSAGQIKAREIRGAKISSIGDVVVEIGIIGSRIKTQGSVHAKYIHNSWIETFGDVVVEHEILDSTIIISGTCNAPKSRILASKISAKRGIHLVSVGSHLTEPSDISAGSEEHIARQSLQITRQINNVRKELDALVETKTALEQEIKELFKKMVELKIAYDKANAKVKELEVSDEMNIATDKKVKEKNERFQKTGRLIDEIKKKMEESLDDLKKHNQQKKTLELRLEKTENSIIKVKPKVEGEIAQLELDRNRFLKWAELKPAIPEIRVSGRLSEGTIVKGVFASMTIDEDVWNIKLVEKAVESEPEAYQIKMIQETNNLFKET